MRQLTYVLIAFIMISCTDKKSCFLDGEWIYKTIYLNENKTDSLVPDFRIKFLDNGEIIKDKYSVWGKYKIEGDKFHFLASDTISATYNIVDVSSTKLELENKEKTRIDGIDTILYRKMIFIKTNTLTDKPYDKFLIELAKYYDIDKPDTLGDGTLFYSIDAKRYSDDYQIVYDNPYKAETKIKGILDKSLGILPQKEKKDEFSEWCMCIQSSYEWENLELVVKMQNDYLKTTENQIYLNSRIWITEK